MQEPRRVVRELGFVLDRAWLDEVVASSADVLALPLPAHIAVGATRGRAPDASLAVMVARSAPCSGP